MRLEMRLNCVLCNESHDINDQTPIAKRLRNRPIHTYMCPDCYDRITERTIMRMETGKYRIYHKEVQKNEKW